MGSHQIAVHIRHVLPVVHRQQLAETEAQARQKLAEQESSARLAAEQQEVSQRLQIEQAYAVSRHKLRLALFGGGGILIGAMAAVALLKFIHQGR